MAAAASQTKSLKHFIFSLLPPAEVMSKGKHQVPHFDYKNRAVEWMKVHTAKLHEITTYIYVGFYPNNFVNEALFRFVKVVSRDLFFFRQ